MRGRWSFKIVVILSMGILRIASAQLTFSEIMYDVATNEYHDEFIEIFNRSNSESVDVSGFQFSDDAGVDNIISIRGGVKIHPRSYAIIVDGSYFTNSIVYDAIIPDSVVILTISDNSFGKNGLSNSSSEYLTLRDSSGSIVTFYSYSTGNIPGRSDEKIDLDGANVPDNWADSEWDGGTPGYQNSVSPIPYDFGFDASSLMLPEKIYTGMPLIISIQINQYGTTTLSDSMEILVFSDLNNDTIFQVEDRLIGRETLLTSAQVIEFEWNDIPTGLNYLIIEIRFDMDQNIKNDKLVRTVEVLNSGGDLIINEIKFLEGENESEWLELYNLGEEEVYLKGWSIADKTDTVLIDSAAYISPSEYLVISKKPLSLKYQISEDHLVILKKFITFNDQGDEIRLIAPNGDEIQRIVYESDWLEGEDFRNPSLEKINPILAANVAENWGPSIDEMDATPGYQNSIFSSLTKIQGKITARPDPFSPDGDGIDDRTLINGNVPETSGRIRALIFDVRGRKIKSLRENRFTGSQFNIVWDGKDDNGNLARIGIYIVCIQVLNDRRGTLHELKTTVILAQKL